jgi:putative transposase
VTSLTFLRKFGQNLPETVGGVGQGRCVDDVFIKRLGRSLKYEAVYLHELTDGFTAERVIGAWIDFYNTERRHSALDGQIPAEAYGAEWPLDMKSRILAA